MSWRQDITTATYPFNTISGIFMRQGAARLSNTQKFLITLSLILIAVVSGYRYFLEKSRQVELYDSMHSQISSMRVSISKLEYLLDMYVVARRFENTTVDIIKGDVRSIDESISSVLDNNRYLRILKNNPPLAEGLDSIGEDWLTIKNEIKRLNAAMSQDELMLTHNAVDMNTIVVTEKADRLLGVIAEGRKQAFTEAKGVALKGSIAFVIMSLAAALVYYRRVIRPLGAATETVDGFAGGDLSARVKGIRGGSVGQFAEALNSMFESAAGAYGRKQDENRDAKAKLEKKTSQIKSIDALMTFAGRTLSLGEFFNAVVREAVCNGADAAAIYSLEGSLLKLRASSGFDSAVSGEISMIGTSELDGLEKEADPSVFTPQTPHPSARYWSVLKGQGYSALICVPLSYNSEVTGFLYAALTDERSLADGTDAFIETLGSCIAVSSGHLGLFLSELASRRFFERILNQMPSGIAIFERSGRCIFMSASLRRFLGVDQQFDPDKGYNLFEDEYLRSHGMTESIRRSFDGHAFEARGIYDPAVNAKFGFGGRIRRARLRSLPLYDAGGEITSVMLIYDDLDEAEPGSMYARPEK